MREMVGRRVPTVREWVIELVVMVAIGVALAALGPFGSFAIDPFGARLAYWIPAALIGYAIFRPITLAAVLVARRLDLPELGAAAVGVTIAAVPATFAIAYFGGYRPGAGPSFDQLFQLYVQVAVIGVLVTTVMMLIDRNRPAPEATIAVTSPQATPPRASPFLNRYPPPGPTALSRSKWKTIMFALTDPGPARCSCCACAMPKPSLRGSSGCAFTAAGGSLAARSTRSCATVAATSCA